MACTGDVCGDGAVPGDYANRESARGSLTMLSPVTSLQWWPKAAASGGAGDTGHLSNTGSWLPAAPSSVPSDRP